MKILVTGGAGFIGSEFIRLIIRETCFDVVNVDCITYASGINSLRSVSGNSRYVHEVVNVCDNVEMRRVFNFHKPLYVVHLAAETHVDNSIISAAKFIETNIVGTFQLLEETRFYFENLPLESRNKFRFLHVSTDEVYGDLANSEGFFTENTRYNPSSPYSASKACSDHLVRAWSRTYGLPTIISNCSNNYGPYQFPEKLIPKVILSALSGTEVPVYGDGKQVRDWLYVEDHARALLEILINAEIGETYNIGGHNQKANIEVVNQICTLLDELVFDKPKNIKCYGDLVTFVKDRPGHDQKYAVDSSKIQNDLSWFPRETFESGLRKTVNWYLTNQYWYNTDLSSSYNNE